MVQYREGVLLHRSNDEWTSVSEEPQWTQITEDESTWPPELTLVVIDSYCGFRNGKKISAKSIARNTSEYEIEQLYGAHWTHIPIRKKEEKHHVSDESIEQLKRAETEARLLELERKAGEFDDFIRSQKRKESSPWKSTDIKPEHSGMFLLRRKSIKGFIMNLHIRSYDSLLKIWSHNEVSDYINGYEWMEIPK